MGAAIMTNSNDLIVRNAKIDTNKGYAATTKMTPQLTQPLMRHEKIGHDRYCINALLPARLDTRALNPGNVACGCEMNECCYCPAPLQQKLC